MMGATTGAGAETRRPAAPAHHPAFEGNFDRNHVRSCTREELRNSAGDIARRRAQARNAPPASTVISLSPNSRQRLENETRSATAQTAFANGQLYTTSPIKMRALKISSGGNHRYYKKKPRSLEIGGKLNSHGTYSAHHFHDISGKGKSFTFAENRITYDEDGNPI